jgi:hypothetical protein
MNITTKKVFFAILMLGVTTSFSLYGAKEKDTGRETWQRFTAESNGFSIDLPQKPEHIHQVITIPKTDMKIDYDTYISEPSDKVVYVISVWKYPDAIDMSKPEVNLQDGFGGMLSALPDSEVLQMNMTEVEGNKALEFLVKNEDIFFHGKLILVDNTLYQIFCVYKEEENMEENYDHFIDSFRLIEGKKGSTKEEKKIETNNSAQKMSV